MGERGDFHFSPIELMATVWSERISFREWRESNGSMNRCVLVRSVLLVMIQRAQGINHLIRVVLDHNHVII